MLHSTYDNLWALVNESAGGIVSIQVELIRMQALLDSVLIFWCASSKNWNRNEMRCSGFGTDDRKHSHKMIECSCSLFLTGTLFIAIYRCERKQKNQFRCCTRRNYHETHTLASSSYFKYNFFRCGAFFFFWFFSRFDCVFSSLFLLKKYAHGEY